MNNYILATFGVVVLLLLLYPIGRTEAEEPQVQEPTLTHQQRVYLHALQFCESSGRADIKILDSNNKHSYGGYMFQMATFLSQGKKYGLLATSTTSTEGEELIYDIELQEAIAHRMLLDGGERNWYHCTRKLGTYPKD